MPKVKDKERILKAAREKQVVIYEEAPINLSADFSKKFLRLEGIGKTYSKCRQGPTTKITLSSKANT